MDQSALYKVMRQGADTLSDPGKLMEAERIVANTLYSKQGQWTKLRNRILDEEPSLEHSVSLLISLLKIDNRDDEIRKWLEKFVAGLIRTEARVLKETANDLQSKSDDYLKKVPEHLR